jgi:hypothetical protein
MCDEKYTYFHFISEYMGNHYFRVDNINKTVNKVTIEVPSKKGRAHCIGIYRLAFSSFHGSYFWYFGRKNDKNRMLVTTKNQYNQAIEQLTKTFITD